MSRSEIKSRAREQLGGRLFGSVWLTALFVCFVEGLILSAAGSLLAGIGGLLLLGPLSYGLNLYFLKQARYGAEAEFKDLFSGFTDDLGGTLLLGLLTSVFALLWGLLFIIPGIVKSYSYSMCYFIKIDRPELDWRACIDASCEMMNGHKWELFVLDLSFIGWLLLSALCLGIGELWVIPYMNASHAQFYEAYRLPNAESRGPEY